MQLQYESLLSKRAAAKKNPKANVPEGTEDKDMEKRPVDEMASMLQADVDSVEPWSAQSTQPLATS